MARYYADTYALVEILKGNPAYEKYAGEELVTSEFNLLELAYALTRDYGKDIAISVLRVVRAHVTIIQPSDEDYAEASMARIEFRKKGKNLSIIDALGYVLAKRLGARFLTGDREFEGLEGVEYVR